MATKHLLERGARRIVFVGDPQLPEVEHRFKGYSDALASAVMQTLHLLGKPVPQAVSVVGYDDTVGAGDTFQAARARCRAELSHRREGLVAEA